MATYLAAGIQFFEGDDAWARGNAVWVKQNTEALAEQAALVNLQIGGSDLTSWFGAFEMAADGSLQLIEAWHLDSTGTVQPGLPSDAEPEPEPEPTENPAAWQVWDGNNENLYQVGDEVTHNGFVWVSTAADNHWEPGEFGWDQLRPA